MPHQQMRPATANRQAATERRSFLPRVRSARVWSCLLYTSVLDTLQNGDTSLAVLDMSAACHTPDVIEMPYRPPLLDAGEPGEKPCTIRLGGPTCLAGDVVGDYSFDAPLAEGDRLLFGDMAIYKMCIRDRSLPTTWVPPGSPWAEQTTATC